MTALSFSTFGHSGASAEAVAALKRLLQAVDRLGDCSGGIAIGKFLLCLWNGRNHPMDITQLSNLNAEYLNDVFTVMAEAMRCYDEVHTWVDNGSDRWQRLVLSYGTPKQRREMRKYREHLAQLRAEAAA